MNDKDFTSDLKTAIQYLHHRNETLSAEILAQSEIEDVRKDFDWSNNDTVLKIILRVPIEIFDVIKSNHMNVYNIIVESFLAVFNYTDFDQLEILPMVNSLPRATSSKQPKNANAQKVYKGLSQEQWDFLVLMVEALEEKQIKNPSPSSKGFYIFPVIENEKITGFKNFTEEFAHAYQNDLKISREAFSKLVVKGFFNKAKNGNYYLAADKILAAVEDYHTQEVPSENSIFRLPDTSPQFQCDIFMVMPFREHLNPVYTDHIRPLAESIGYKILRGDDTFSQHDIITEIWSLISNADLIIADCTDKNANVFYEMGLAHAIGKIVIPIAQKEEDIPFDIRQRRYIKYENTEAGLNKLKEELKRAIQSILGEA